MKEEKYKDFIRRNLDFFRNRYKISKNKSELKKAVFNNPKLNEPQKNDFWNLVTKKSEELYEI